MVESVHIRLSAGLAMLGMKKRTIVYQKLKFVGRTENGMECNAYVSQGSTSSMVIAKSVPQEPATMVLNVHWHRESSVSYRMK